MKSSRIISGICAVVMSASMLAVTASATEPPAINEFPDYTAVDNGAPYSWLNADTVERYASGNPATTGYFYGTPSSGKTTINPTKYNTNENVWQQSIIDEKEGTAYIAVRSNINIGKSTDGIYGKDNRSIKVALSKTELVYSGKKKKPTVTVRYGTEVLKKGKDYKLVFPKDTTSIGKKTIKIVGLGRYTGSRTVSYYVVPKTVKLKIKNYEYSEGAEVTWALTPADGYEIEITKDPDFVTGVKRFNIDSGKVSKAVLYNLQRDTDYYVRVRAYVNTEDGKRYGNWSDKSRQRRAKKGCKCYCYKWKSCKK